MNDGAYLSLSFNFDASSEAAKTNDFTRFSQTKRAVGRFTDTTNENKNISCFIESNAFNAFTDLSYTHLNMKYTTI